jgi:hypothetical protein
VQTPLVAVHSCVRFILHTLEPPVVSLVHSRIESQAVHSPEPSLVLEMLSRLQCLLALAVSLFLSASALRGLRQQQQQQQHRCGSTFTLATTSSFYDSSVTADDAEPSLKVALADALISTVFRVPALFDLARHQARSSMQSQGLQIGVDWEANVGALLANMESLNVLYDKLDRTKSSSLSYPSYYLKPFHAYDDGNLSWQAAMEVDSAALTVHAKVYTVAKDELDPGGDATLRRRFHQNMRTLLDKHAFKPKAILDIGCSTGLSTWELHRNFPDSEIVGADLSPHMLAVAQLSLMTRPELTSARSEFYNVC